MKIKFYIQIVLQFININLLEICIINFLIYKIKKIISLSNKCNDISND